MQVLFLLVSFYVVMSFVSLLINLYDKQASKSDFFSRWRVREKTLIYISICGGFVGSLVSMYWLRHKTKHENFVLIYWLSLFFHVVIVGIIYNYLIK